MCPCPLCFSSTSFVQYVSRWFCTCKARLNISTGIYITMAPIESMSHNYLRPKRDTVKGISIKGWCKSSSGSLQFKWLQVNSDLSFLSPWGWQLETPGHQSNFRFLLRYGTYPFYLNMDQRLFTFVLLVKKNFHKEAFLSTCQHQSEK